MKVLIAYSSKTGNTRKIAEAIRCVIPNAELYKAHQAPDPAGYDLVFSGFWVDKGSADAGAQIFMSKLKQQKVALFSTLGAYPDSQHATDSLNAATLLIVSCEIVGRFICQGKINPKLIEWMMLLPPEHGHAPDESRMKRWRDAESHPNNEDLARASEWAIGVLQSVTALQA